MRTLLLLAPLALAACAADPGVPTVVDVSAAGPDAGVKMTRSPAGSPHTATPLFWDDPCIHNPAETQIQLGKVGNPNFVQYTWGGTHTTTSPSVIYGVNQYAYDLGCSDAFLVDVSGTNQQFGVVVNYQDALPTNENACLQTSIWVSGYTYGNYLGAYADHLGFSTRWNRYDAYGAPLPMAQQSPRTDLNMYDQSDSVYAYWLQGRCYIAPLELTYRHPDYPFGPSFPWYRLVIGGFRGTSSTSYIPDATIQVKVGLDPGVPGCKPVYSCYVTDAPPTNPPTIDQVGEASWATITCADGVKNRGVIPDAQCKSTSLNDIKATDVIGLGLIILGLLLGL